jgi:hypothetical protein
VSDHARGVAAWDGEKLRLTDPVVFNASMRRLKPGDGEAFVIRVEREADAKRHHQLKWYYGFVVKQCVEKTGYPVPEMDAIFRAQFMPGDVETLSLMSYEQMEDFNRQCEQYAAEVIGVVVEGPDGARRWVA